MPNSNKNFANKNPSIILFGNTSTHRGKRVKIDKFVDLVGEVSNKIMVVSGRAPRKKSENIVWINVGYNKNKKSNIVFRLLEYIYIELKLFFRLLRGLNKEDSQYSLTLFLLPYLLPMLVMRIMGKKVIRYQAGTPGKGSKGMARIKEVIFKDIPSQLSDIIIVQTEGCIEFQNLSKYREKVSICKFGGYVDVERFNANETCSMKENNIGYLGYLVEKKGIKNLIKSIQKIRNKEKNIKLIIGGEGPLKEKTEQLVEDMCLEDSVEFKGWVDRENIPSFLRNLKLLVIPSVSEGVPTVGLEAMASGTPVLATPVGGIPDIIEDKETGFIIRNNSPDCIAENILRALNYQEFDNVIKKSRDLVAKKFGRKKVVREYKDIIDQICRSKN